MDPRRVAFRTFYDQLNQMSIPRTVSLLILLDDRRVDATYACVWPVRSLSEVLESCGYINTGDATIESTLHTALSATR